jgi:hypothetical protein
MIFCKVLITNGCGIVFGKQGPEVRTETSPRADRRTTNRQEADSDERASRVRPKGQAQDARGQLWSEGPSGAAASQYSHPDHFARQGIDAR